MKNIFPFFLLLLSHLAQAQNTFRTETNPHYWKNKKPYEGYWQQDVAYTIKATIDETTNIISASESVEYYNNSPKALPYIYIHLYQNAFTNGSYLDQLYHANKIKNTQGKYLANGLGTTVDSILVDGQKCKTEMDNTILKINLPKALLPNNKITISLQFKTYFDNGTMRRRMQMYNSWDYTHFNGCHWYPRIAVYDKKKGWDTDQHLNKELYGDYGSFDVELNFANNYIVEATGELQNKNEVLPDTLWQKIQLKNFANKNPNEKPSEIIAYKKGERKTWKYHADNVHDFAFTADPSYRIDEQEWNGIKCVAIVQEPHAAGWQKSASYICQIIKTFSTDFGMYNYPKIVAADANDGMEYPMITMDGGADPDNRSLLVHEIGHNWFYGMIGNNETYRAALDEGFTQFLTAWGLEKIDGKNMVNSIDKRRYVAKHRDAVNVKDRNVFYGYINSAMRGDDGLLNTHSNDFHSGLAHENGYGSVYYKTATMLYNLQYILGDTLFQSAMQHYVQQWKFCHPYFEDFRNSIVEYTQVDLNWFFDQWLETKKTIDYGIKGITKKKDGYNITFKRFGDMQMPIDFTVTDKENNASTYTIPNTNWFVKKEAKNVLPTWYGWDLLNQTYTAHIATKAKIKSVQIDTSYTLADIDMSDNKASKTWLGTKLDNTITRFDYLIKNVPSRRNETVFWRPDMWWNGLDGIKAGLHAEGSFMNYIHKFSATMWYNSHLLTSNVFADGFGNYDNSNPFDFSFMGESNIKKINKKWFVGINLRSLEGLSRGSVYSYLQVNANNNLRAECTSMYRNAGLQYQNYSQEWSSYIDNRNRTSSLNNSNTYVQCTWFNTYKKYKSNGSIKTTVRANIPLNQYTVTNYNYAYIQSEWLHTTTWHKLDIKSRGFVRFGMGNAIPSESALYLAGANNEEMAENKFTRTSFINNADFASYHDNGFAHVQQGGGLNLRGYTGYYALEEDKNNNIYINYKGKSGAAINTEIDFDRYINVKPKLTKNWLHVDAYVFADAGSISRGVLQNNISTLVPTDSWSKVRVDAGIGTAFTIKNWARYDKLEPLTIRVDLPFFINSTPYALANKNIDFSRWVIGINRCF